MDLKHALGCHSLSIEGDLVYHPWGEKAMQFLAAARKRAFASAPCHHPIIIYACHGEQCPRPKSKCQLKDNVG
jgi:hypothetical protein